MRQLEIVGAGAVEWREAAAPVLQGDVEALVRPRAVALCDLDAVFLGGVVPIARAVRARARVRRRGARRR